MENFIHAHWDVLASVDFTTIEAWTKGRLVSNVGCIHSAED
jgi:hypothetical protein